MKKCKKCDSKNLVKAGFARGSQKFKCKDCKSFQILGDKRCKYSSKIKALAVVMYLENVGLRNIGKILKLPYQTVSKWIKNEAVKLPETIVNTREIEVLGIDEIVTFCKKNAVKSGFGLQLTETGIKLLILR
jgi:transposase-like protein